MKYWPLIGLLFIGCGRYRSISSILSLHTGGRETLAAHENVLVMGQSNAYYFDPSAYRGWNEARHSSDTFINCAEKGTSIAQWSPSGTRWQNCLNMVGNRHIDVILWYQGETDANPEIGGNASDYAYQLTRLFGVWRGKFPNIPIVFAQIASVDINKLPAFVNWQEVKDQQASVFYPGASMIKTDDIVPGPLSHDGIHFDEPGFYQIGIRMANAYINRHLN